MRRPAVFFDRDNTLIASDGYLAQAAKVVLVKGAAQAIARARQLGFATVVFSNQSGVARGLFNEDAVHAVNNRLDELLAEQDPGAVIDRHEFCPFHPEGSVEQYTKESPLRKPAPGMILQAAEKLALDLSRSWVIGDAPRDIEAGKSAGCRTILFQDPALPTSPAASATPRILPEHFVQSLKEAMDIIEKENSGEPSTSRDEPVEPSNAQLSTSNEQAAAPASVPVQYSTVTTAQVTPKPIAPAAAAGHFSISKMIAGIVQMLAIATLLLAYRADNPQNTLLVAIMLQLLTIALLIMGRQG